MPQYKNPSWLKDRVWAAIGSFNKSEDLFLLMDEESDDGINHGAVGERAIAHRFAVHLEAEFLAWGYPNNDVRIAVDCEYNGHRGAVKAFLVKNKIKERVEAAKGKLLKEHPTKEGLYVFSVYPDIIVHQRGSDANNLIVIEIKRASNTLDDKLDKEKLQLFTAQDYQDGYGYVVGASIIAFDEDKFGARRLEPSAFYSGLPDE